MKWNAGGPTRGALSVLAATPVATPMATPAVASSTGCARARSGTPELRATNTYSGLQAAVSPFQFMSANTVALQQRAHINYECDGLCFVTDIKND